MSFTQTTFMGASISQFSASIGWGRNASSLRVELVEDPVNGDSFAEPLAGQPVYFSYEGWTFGGLIQDWRKRRGSDANPIYSVTVVDPRDLLDGVQLILNGYTGSVYNIPNLYNIYGYLEALYGYGGSQANDTGIPWYLVKNAFLALQTSTTLRLKGYFYKVDLSNIFGLPNTFRIPGESVSLLEFIDIVADAASCEYFVTLVYSGGVNWITLNFISRASAPSLGTIYNFVNSVNSHEDDAGVEFRNETTSKFLVGGNVEQLYYKNQSAGVLTSANTIWPYWGFFTTTGVLIEGVGNFEIDYTYYGNGTIGGTPHYFTIDISPVKLTYVANKYRSNNQPNGVPYTADVSEMRAALIDQRAWETFLWTHADRGGIHNRKVYDLNITSEKPIAVLDTLKAKFAAGGEPGKEPLSKVQTVSAKIYNLEKFGSSTDTHKIEINNLYNYIAKYAQEYYGKKFMVKLSEVYVKRESGTNRIVTNLEPVTSAFVEEALWATAINASYLPYELDKFTDEDSKFTAFVKFNNFKISGVEQYDLTNLSPDDYTLWNNTLFVRCEVDPNLVFDSCRESSVLSILDPKVLITLPDRIFYTGDKNMQVGYIYTLLQNRLALNASQMESMFAKATASVISDYKPARAFMPDVAAIPLRNNTLTYGPWYVQGADGKTEFEQDTSLVPWEYGGYTQMNIAANALLQNILSNCQDGESATVTFAGVPAVQLGGLLVASGPYVTDISTSIGPDGVTTTYNMRTWTQMRGNWAKHFADNRKRMYELDRRRKREARILRSMVKGPSVKQLSSMNKIDFKTGLPARYDTKTPHMLIAAQAIDDTGVLKQSEVFTAKHEDLITTVSNVYAQLALGSMDTIFRPFSTDATEADGFKGAHFTTPTATGITVTELHPFTAPHDFAVTARNDTIPTDGLAHTDYGDANDVYRLVGLRGPVVIVGWGYDVNGKPVPNATPGSPGSSFADDYRRRTDLWKAGPLDCRWNDEKGVWIASAEVSGCKIGTIAYGTVITDGSTGSVDVYDENGDTGTNLTCKNITGVTLSGVLQVMIDYPTGYSYPLISPYKWTICS